MEVDVSKHNIWIKSWRLQDKCICDKGASLEAESRAKTGFLRVAHDLVELAEVKNIL